EGRSASRPCFAKGALLACGVDSYGSFLDGSPRIRSHSMRALLVEADGPLRMRLQTILTEGDWLPTAVSSASSAFETFQAQTFPLVVVSSRLPDLEGVAFMHKLRALPRGDEACVLVTHSGPVSDTALIEAGADDIIDTVRGPELLRTRFALARNRVRRGARSNAEDLVRVFERALRESEVRY